MCRQVKLAVGAATAGGSAKGVALPSTEPGKRGRAVAASDVWGLMMIVEFLNMFYDRTGTIGYVIVVLSVIALALIVLKLLQLAPLRRTGVRACDEALAALESGDTEIANQRLAKQQHPAAKVLDYAIKLAGNDQLTRPAMVDRVAIDAQRRIDELSWGHRPLGAIAVLSPLLGLLGTVVGMIVAFAQLEQSGDQVSPTLLAGGVWQALLTTAMGLGLAIPVRASLYVFEARADQAAVDIQQVGTRALHALRPIEQFDPSSQDQITIDAGGESC